MGFLARIYGEIGRQLKRLNLTRGQIMAIALVGAAVALFMVFLAVFGMQTDYVPLSQQPASAEDRVKVTEALRNQGIEYTEEDGRIMVPASRLADARMAMPTVEGLSAEFVGGIYYSDISPGDSPLTPQDTRRWQQAIALENEIGRDLTAIDGIGSAKVRISRPKQTSRLVKTPDASASVMVRKRVPGSRLPQSTVDAIASYVSRAVPSLPIGNVRIIDADSGRTHRPKDDTDDFYLADNRRQQERQFAEDIRKRLVERFEAIFPAFAGQIYIDVAAQLDLDLEHETSVTYDTEKYGHTLTVTETEEYESNPPRAGDIQTNPNTRDNITTAGAGVTTSEERNKTTKEQWDPSWTKVIVKRTPGNVERLALSVVLPFEGVKTVAQKRLGTEQELTAAQVQAAVDEQISRYRQMLTTAYGIYGDNATQVDVSAVYTAAPEPPALVVLTWQDRLVGLLESYGGEIFLGVVTLAGFLVLWRTLRRGEDIPSYEDELAREDEEEELPSLDDLLPKAEVDVSRLRTMKMTDVIKDAVQDDPSTAAQLIRRWMERER